MLWRLYSPHGIGALRQLGSWVCTQATGPYSYNHSVRGCQAVGLCVFTQC